jgi:hypothetical protein
MPKITTLVHFSAASLAAEVMETLPQALKRGPRTDGSYARLKACSTIVYTPDVKLL